MSDDPFNPAMRRIAPSDLLAPRPVAAPRPARWPDPTFPPDSSASPPGSTSLPTTAPPPSSAQPSAASGTCPHCNGAGWYKEAVPFGHPRFGKPLPCACKLAEREVLAQRRQQERLQQLIGVAGRFATATFDTFAADRAYPGPVEWIDPRYGDSNKLDRVVLPSEPEWRKVMDGEVLAPSPSTRARPKAVSPASPAAPAWGQPAASPPASAAPAWSRPAQPGTAPAAAPAATPAPSGPAWLNT